MHRFGHRFSWVAAATIAVMLLMVAAACAAPIQSKMTTAPQGERAQALSRAQTALDAGGVTGKLKAYGLTDQQINQRLGQLSADELSQLTTGAEAVAAGGAQTTMTTTTWLLIIVVVLLLVS